MKTHKLYIIKKRSNDKVSFVEFIFNRRQFKLTAIVGHSEDRGPGPPNSTQWATNWQPLWATVKTLALAHPTAHNELRTGNAGERTLEFESEVFLVENVQGFTGDDERSSTWTVTSPVVLGHHAGILHTQTHTCTRRQSHADRQTSRTSCCYYEQ